MTRCAAICRGSGNCTRMPSTAASALSCASKRQQLGLARRRRQAMLEAGDARLGRRLALAADIDVARRIVADEHRGEARHDAVPRLELAGSGGDSGAQRGGMRLAVDELGVNHGRSTSSSRRARAAGSPATCTSLRRWAAPSASVTSRCFRSSNSATKRQQRGVRLAGFGRRRHRHLERDTAIRFRGEADDADSGRLGREPHGKPQPVGRGGEGQGRRHRLSIARRRAAS